MSELSAYLAAAVLLGFSGYRLGTDRRGTPYQTRHYGYGLMICLALTMALLAPATPRLLAGPGVDRAAVIMLGDTVRTAAMSLLMFMASSIRRRPVRGVPVFAAVGTQFARTVLFILAGPVVSADDSLVTHGSGRWLLAAYDLLFAGYAEWALAGAAAAFAHEARRAGPGPVRTGIRLSLAACAVGMAWAVWAVDDVVDVARTGLQDGSEDLVSNALGALCAVLIVAATFAAKWHAGYDAVRERIRMYVLYRRLTPLWEALRAELPQIAFDGERRGLRSRRSLDFVLYRRVIEIHDGRLALRPFAPEQDGGSEYAGRAGRLDHSHRSDHPDRDVVREAAAIVAALENHRAGRRSAPGESVHGPEEAWTVAAEAAWLADVASAFIRLRQGPELRGRDPIHLR